MGAWRDLRPKRCVLCSTLQRARPWRASVRPTAPTHGPDLASVRFCHEGISVVGRYVPACQLPALHPGNVPLQLGTQLHGRLVDAQTRNCGIKIQMIAR